MSPTSDKLKSRSPVVAVVGHVDHGKTAFLDYIRKTNVVEREAGGITQSIGAYEVEHKGKKITFIDTPGHEAFTKMRARGASAADLAILIISADEGIKQQTKEAAEILKATKTPFLIALTKIDKENANVERVKNDLMSEGLLLEGLGGDISWQAISSKTGEGINELLDLVLLMSEVIGFKYNPSQDAAGFVIESRMDSRRGVVAHLVVKDGVLRRGSNVKTLSASGKIKILEDFLGRPADKIEPSAPALVIGFGSMPQGGEEFVAGDRELASGVVEGGELSASGVIDDSSENPKAVLKADTNGSLEALKELVRKEVEIVSASVWDIVDGDIQFAKSTQAVVVGFMVGAKKSALNLAEVHGIKVFTSKIVYELLDEIKEFKAKEKQDFAGGELEVLATFGATPHKRTVGGKVVRGSLKIGNSLNVKREGEVVGKGKIKSLEYNKGEVKEVNTGSECGLVVETTTLVEKGDLLEVIQ